MKKSRIRPVDQQKEQLDRDTPYLTLLPDMDEGLHIGYKPTAGIQSDGNQKPMEWLDQFAKFIKTQGEDVGYSIPDVLASEQQLRRLARLPGDMALRHQEMVDYRGVLALLLLWDVIASDSACATLTIEPVLEGAEEGSFSGAVGRALPESRAREGLYVFALSRPKSENPEKTPICLLSRAMIVMPAANLGDLSNLLPPSVNWYDRSRKRFVDPCPYLDEEMCAVLIPRLRLLQTLNEETPGSYIYSPEAQLCALLDKFIRDILAEREGWRESVKAGDESAVEGFRTRILTIYGLAERQQNLQLEMFTYPADASDAGGNVLISGILPAEGIDLPENAGEDAVLYTMNGVPFARFSTAFLLEPARSAGEEEMLARAREEIALLDQYDEAWRGRMAKVLGQLSQETQGRTGVDPAVPELLHRWSVQYANAPQYGDSDILLRYPEDTSAQTLSPLLERLFGEGAEGCIREPFSDCLLLMDQVDGCPLPEWLAEICRVQDVPENHSVYFVPPISQNLATWLMEKGQTGDLNAPRLLPESLRCRMLEDGRIEASFAVGSRSANKDGVLGKVTFVRTYELRALPEKGAAVTLAAAAMPSVTVWPNVRLASGQWKQYFVHTHNPQTLDAFTWSGTEWTRGSLRSAQGQQPGQMDRRSWHTVRTEQFPAYVSLRRGSLGFGMLLNDLPFTQLRYEQPAIIGVDFGSIATTVMMRQGDKVQPASLPEILHGVLLSGEENLDKILMEEFLPWNALVAGQPGESTYYSVVDLFGHGPEDWQNVLEDGHIYYPDGMAALMQKNSNTLYYDLKWSDEEFVLRCLRLFLKQMMLQASLAARLWGSASLSWRVSVPGALPPHRQEAYLDMMRGLAREVAKETGMPLTGGCPPVLYALENQADGLYFRHRNEVNAGSGYVNLDIGGSTADLSLWLSGGSHATAECSLLLGCRKILYGSIAAGHVDDFRRDFTRGNAKLAAAADGLADEMLNAGSSTRAQQKSMLLMDDFFASYAGKIRRAISEFRAQGQISYTESLLLFNFAFLFRLSGLMMQRAYEDQELRQKLPRRMEICIAGNGGQLLKVFSREQLQSLCMLALGVLCKEHPVKILAPVQSADPKQEVALGLLHSEGDLHSTLQSVERWNGTFLGDDGQSLMGEEEFLTTFLEQFARSFPQAANRLLSAAMAADSTGDARLTAAARMELSNILANEHARTPEDDFGTYIRCFAAMKKLWRV